VTTATARFANDVRRLFLALGGVFVALLVMELTLRLVAPCPRSPIRSTASTRTGARGAGTAADGRHRFRRPQFDGLHRPVCAGAGARPVAARRLPAQRALVLGDSFRWGWGVPQGAVYTDVLQRAAGRAASWLTGVNSRHRPGVPRAAGGGSSSLRRLVVQFFFNDLMTSVRAESSRRPAQLRPSPATVWAAGQHTRAAGPRRRAVAQGLQADVSARHASPRAPAAAADATSSG
jgi:hypothetical protein